MFTLATPYMILTYHSWHFYACWLPLVLQGNLTQLCFFDSLDTLQVSSSQGCLSPGLINHFLCLILGVQLLYSLIRYCFIQFQCAVVVICCFFSFIAQYLVVSPIFCWAWSEPSSSDLMSLWMHLSASIISCKTVLFHSSSDSLLTYLSGGMSASLHMVFLCFSCSVFCSGLFFWQVCFLTGLLSNCSIALFIISWNSLMNSSLSALQLASNKFSLSSDSSWSLSWSWGGSFATSCYCTLSVPLPDISVRLHLSIAGHLGICSLVFSGSLSTCLSLLQLL